MQNRMFTRYSNTAVTYLIRGSVPDDAPAELLDDHRALEPPDPIPNSAVKRRIADGSVGLPHVRVGHRQAPIPNPRYAHACRGFVFVRGKTATIAMHAEKTDAGTVHCSALHAAAVGQGDPPQAIASPASEAALIRGPAGLP